MHEGEFAIAKDYLDRWYFKRADGQAVPHCGYRLEDILDDDLDTNGDALNMNPSAEEYTSAEGLPALLHNSPPWSVAERSPAAYKTESCMRSPAGVVYLSAWRLERNLTPLFPDLEKAI